MYGCIYIYIYVCIYIYIFFLWLLYRHDVVHLTFVVFFDCLPVVAAWGFGLVCVGVGWFGLVLFGLAWFNDQPKQPKATQSNPKQPKASQSNPKHCITGDDRWIWVMIDGGGQQWHRATGTGHKAPGDSGPRNQFPTYTEHRAYRNLGLCLAFCFKCSSSTTLWALISSLLQVWCCRMMRTLPPPLQTSWGSRLHHHQRQ